MESQLLLFMPPWILLILHWSSQQLDICVFLHVSECNLFSAFFATIRSPLALNHLLKVKVKVAQSVLSDSATPGNIQSMEFSRAEYWSG